MRGQGTWEAAVEHKFAENLIEKIEELKADCEVAHASEIAKEVGNLVIELIQQTFQDI